MSSAKHVDVRVKFKCDYAKPCIDKPQYIELELMLADLLTKVPLHGCWS